MMMMMMMIRSASPVTVQLAVRAAEDPGEDQVLHELAAQSHAPDHVVAQVHQGLQQATACRNICPAWPSVAVIIAYRYTIPFVRVFTYAAPAREREKERERD